MDLGYREKLVHTYSEDGYRLDGVVVRPEDGPPRPVAVVLVHGLYASFYVEPMLELARGLARAGYLVVNGNNRGHDFGAILHTEAWRIVPAGGGWERLEAAPLDIGAWVAVASSLGFPRVALLGHSLGARKVVWYQVSRRDPAVAALVLASPRVLFEPDDASVTALARRLVDEGQGQALLPWPEMGVSLSARTFLDHEEPDALFRHLLAATAGPAPVAVVRCPILAFYGQDEVGDGRDPAAELAVLRASATNAPVDTAMLPGADHLYTGREAEAAGVVAEWLDGTVVG